MTKIEFFMSVDGSAPRTVDVQQVADFAKVILSMRSTVSVSPSVPLQPPRSEVPVISKPRPFPPVPPIGERTIDYAIKAAQSYDGTSFTLKELLLRMEASGWKTRSESQREKVNVLRSTIRERPDFTNQLDGHWTYEPIKQNSPVPDAQASEAGLFVQT